MLSSDAPLGQPAPRAGVAPPPPPAAALAAARAHSSPFRPCPSRRCRWPFAAGFATTAYIFIGIANSVTGARRSEAADVAGCAAAHPAALVTVHCCSASLTHSLLPLLDRPLCLPADEDVKASKFANPKH